SRLRARASHHESTYIRRKSMTPTWEIGKYYRVPAVRVAIWHRFVGWLPVIGPKHEDAEFVNFPHQHFHVNWHFAPERVWTYFRRFGRYETHHFAWPIQCPDNRGDQVILEGPTLK